jgi:hypothetical protein
MKPDLLIFSAWCAATVAVLTLAIIMMRKAMNRAQQLTGMTLFYKDYGVPMCFGFSCICLTFSAITLYLGLGFKL